MLFKSALATDLSGSVGGLTASRNKGGAYFRQRVVPTNPGTPQQAVVRAAMAALTSAWSGELNAGERAGWSLYAENVPLINALGDEINISGLAMYVRSNVPRIQAGLTRVDSAPTVFDLGSVNALNMTAASEASQEVTIAFTESDAWVDEDGSSLIIAVSRPQNQSINYFKGPYRLVGTVDGDATTPPTSPVTFAAPFPFVEGQKLFAQMRVSRADGRLSGTFPVEVVGTA